MLEQPNIDDSLILARLAEAYGLRARQLAFLPLGVDVNAAVYCVVAEDETAYFLKLRKGAFNEIAVSVPYFLAAQGVEAIIVPLETTTRQLWAELGGYKMILYPFVAGENGYEVGLSERQWHKFGAALRGVHSVAFPPALAGRVPRETFSPEWREMVKAFQVEVGERVYEDPTAVRLAAFMRSKRAEISRLVARTNALGMALQGRPLEQVLCHTDIHPGNLLLGENDALHIVDWDSPVLAPKERDLMLIGGCPAWSSARQEALFYQGYGPVEIDPTALAYYRYERIIQDIAAFCQQILSPDTKCAGGEDREQSLVYLMSNFLPDHEIEIAYRQDKAK